MLRSSVLIRSLLAQGRPQTRAMSTIDRELGNKVNAIKTSRYSACLLVKRVVELTQSPDGCADEAKTLLEYAINEQTLAERLKADLEGTRFESKVSDDLDDIRNAIGFATHFTRPVIEYDDAVKDYQRTFFPFKFLTEHPDDKLDIMDSPLLLSSDLERTRDKYQQIVDKFAKIQKNKKATTTSEEAEKKKQEEEEAEPIVISLDNPLELIYKYYMSEAEGGFSKNEQAMVASGMSFMRRGNGHVSIMGCCGMRFDELDLDEFLEGATIAFERFNYALHHKDRDAIRDMQMDTMMAASEQMFEETSKWEWKAVDYEESGGYSVRKAKIKAIDMKFDPAGKMLLGIKVGYDCIVKLEIKDEGGEVVRDGKATPYSAEVLFLTPAPILTKDLELADCLDWKIANIG